MAAAGSGWSITGKSPNLEYTHKWAIENFDFAMAAGEFMDVFGSQTKEWDCVVTCFFIDTAHNVFDYLQTINNVLKVGGLWVNIGPLHWHWSEQPQEL